MKKCWDPTPDNRPKAYEVRRKIELFYSTYGSNTFNESIDVVQFNEIKRQFKESEEYRESHLSSFEKNRHLANHPRAFYTSRLLNPFTRNLPKYDDNIDNNSAEITDFTK